MIMTRFGRVVAVCAWVLGACLAGGCQLPDVGPFVEGTAQLKGAVAAGGAVVEQELRLAFDDPKRADELHANWEARNKAMSALLRYAQSIDAIVAAGNAGAESAGKVADSVKGLAEAAGLAIPGGPAAAAVATDAVKFLYGQIATIRAAGQLAAALDEAQPAVERVAQLMRKDLDDLTVVIRAAEQVRTIKLQGKYKQLNSDRDSILGAMQKHNPGITAERGEYKALTELWAAIKPEYDAYLQESKALDDRRMAAAAVIDATGRALDEWAAAHAELASAARHKRVASTQSLVAAAVELRDLVKRIRDL